VIKKKRGVEWRGERSDGEEGEKKRGEKEGAVVMSEKERSDAGDGYD
jgi:hypothetical protein